MGGKEKERIAYDSSPLSPERDQRANALKMRELRRREDGNAFLKRYSEHSNTFWKVGKELESIKLERKELTRMCTDRKFELRSSANKGQRVQATDLDSASY
jgi:hypothetical protein